ncbi:ATP-grasp fold amidoligase family protein [Vibrio sp. K4]|uniref:ATP-grasp fold amidoligase family protein n=1 Tax=Vibrio sp. K4 TaxID=3391579 RepID=UPI003DA7530C
MNIILKKILNSLPFPIFVKVKSIFKLGYLVNIKSPKTFNEKVNSRKYFWAEEAFSLCSDKLLVKDYVASKIGQEYIIKTLFKCEYITKEDIEFLLSEHKQIVLKANHNSGQVFILKDTPSGEKLDFIVSSLNSQMSEDYGKIKHEPWYSNIKPMILAEEVLIDKSYNDILDFKFHVFTDLKTGSQEVVLQVDFDRHNNHTRTIYDENFNILPFSWAKATVRLDLPKPNNFHVMVDIAKKLGKDFSYVRVDLYNVNEEIYFGEMTFAHGSGFERFSPVFYDTWLGKKWVS